jgi:hypothetical protein
MHHTSRFQLDHKEHEDRAEEHVIRLDEIARPDLIGMIGQKCRPGLTLVVGRLFRVKIRGTDRGVRIKETFNAKQET